MAMKKIPSTAWSVMPRAARSPAEERRPGFASLCEACWYPLYNYARLCGCSPDDARDLTQGYLVLLLEKDTLHDVPSRAVRFSGYLLASFRHFLSKERHRSRAQK